MLKLELKRILKTRSTWWLGGLALVLCVMIGIMAVHSARYYVDEGVTIRGREAIEMTRERQSRLKGEITPEVIEDCYKDYNAAIEEYGGYDMPADVANDRLYVNNTVIYHTADMFLNSEGSGGTWGGIADVELRDFYNIRKAHLHKSMLNRYSKRPEIADYAMELDARVSQPFYYEYGVGDSDTAIEYITVCSFFLAIICAIIAAPLFSSEYASGSDDILRCTRGGKTRLVLIKLLSMLIICFTLFAVCMAVFLLIVLTAYGTDSSSIQMFRGGYAFSGMNVNEFIAMLVLTCVLSFIAVILSTLFFSSRIKSPMVTLAIAIVVIILPTVICLAGWGGNFGNWIRFMLPSGGVGIVSNLFYEIPARRFLWLAKLNIWSPHLLVIVPAVEIPIFFALAVRGYNRHEAV